MSADPTITRPPDAIRPASRSSRIPRDVGLAAGATAVLALAVVLGSLWIGGREIEAAQAEAARLIAEAHAAADAIRTAGAEEIAAVRAETDRAVTAVRAEAETRRTASLGELDAVGAELAETSAERDATRAELERFAAVRERIGIQLAEHHNGRPVIIVPEGHTITPWKAPGLANLARYNGRMFRVVAEP